MNKKGQLGSMVFGVVIFVILIFAFLPVIVENIANADEQYACLDETDSIQSADFLICTNATYSCVNATAPLMNISFDPPLCMNETGVGVYNESASDGFIAYNVSSTDVGLNVVETSLLGIIMLIMIVGAVMLFIKSAGLSNKG